MMTSLGASKTPNYSKFPVWRQNQNHKASRAHTRLLQGPHSAHRLLPVLHYPSEESSKPVLILGIESSCDETAAAVLQRRPFDPAPV